jgi:acetyl esterase/lipase
VSAEQREKREATLRQAALPVGSDVSGRDHHRRHRTSPLVIQAGTHEVLLDDDDDDDDDDAVRLARQAATADVEVTLDLTPGVPHVFQTFYPVLDEATAALDRAGHLLSAHLASA